MFNIYQFQEKNGSICFNVKVGIQTNWWNINDQCKFQIMYLRKTWMHQSIKMSLVQLRIKKKSTHYIVIYSMNEKYVRYFT